MPRSSEKALVQQDVEAAHGRVRLVPRSQWWRVARERACREHGSRQGNRCNADVRQRLRRLRTRVAFGNRGIYATIPLTVGVDAFGRTRVSMLAVVRVMMRVRRTGVRAGNRAGTRGPRERYRDGEDGRDNGIPFGHGLPIRPTVRLVNPDGSPGILVVWRGSMCLSLSLDSVTIAM